MGLFDGGAAKEAAENEVLQALSKQQVLEDLVATVLSEDQKAWVTTCTGYYDGRERSVIFEDDIFAIKWYESHEIGSGSATKEVVDVDECVVYRYTDIGYMPLHGHTCSNGKTVSQDRVLYLWASLVLERLQAKMPDCKFDSPFNNGSRISFKYTVPALEWKDWF